LKWLKQIIGKPMPAGDYIPKYKTGYTVIALGDDGREQIVISTFRGLAQFSSDFASGHSDYDERDKDHVLYAVYDTATKMTCWRWEYSLMVYCCNAARGKKILSEEDHLQRICDNYSIRDDGLLKFLAVLKQPE